MITESTRPRRKLEPGILVRRNFEGLCSLSKTSLPSHNPVTPRGGGAQVIEVQSLEPIRIWMKRSIVIAGHKTSISIEEPFWKSLREIAAAKEMKTAELVAFIDNDRQQGNLSSHIRLFVLEYYQAKAATPNQAEQTTSPTTGTAPR